MTQRSRRLAAPVLASIAGVLAACTTPAPVPGPDPSAQPQAGTVVVTETIVGSRIPRATTERLVRKTGAAGAKEMERDRPPEPGPLNGR